MSSEQLRSLEAIWSKEAEEDLRVMHNLHSEHVLADIIYREMLAEIDYETTNDLMLVGNNRIWKNPVITKADWKKEGF